ncbi:MAG: hypothetical protein KGJ36_01115 [Acidobacteriota bacterium]|nr:hypothetical protein [Acidobacteriota bacterium]
MRLFKRRKDPASAPADASAATSEPDAEAVGDRAQEAAEERQEYDDDVEIGRSNRRGLNPHWGLQRGDEELSRREVRARADVESDGAEERFIRAEREAEERGRMGFRD